MKYFVSENKVIGWRWLLRMKRGLKLSLKTAKPSIREGLSHIGATGFEPMTPTTPKWYATKLRYAP
ncbi:MAG: hypothetical protein RLZZ69_3217 [Cyanobacteriota bacterium]|jgi:predicted secreted protein